MTAVNVVRLVEDINVVVTLALGAAVYVLFRIVTGPTKGSGKHSRKW